MMLVLRALICLLVLSPGLSSAQDTAQAVEPPSGGTASEETETGVSADAPNDTATSIAEDDERPASPKPADSIPKWQLLLPSLAVSANSTGKTTFLVGVDVYRGLKKTFADLRVTLTGQTETDSGVASLVTVESRDSVSEDRPHVVRAAQVQDLFNHLVRRLVRVVVGAPSPASQSLLTKLAIPLPPQIEGRSRNPEVSAGLIDVPDPFGVLNDSLLSMNLSLIVGHSDLLGAI